VHRIFAFLALLALATPAFANEGVSSEHQRPTIGIALGGGGARGLAHVGVLLRLDELRIPVDRVAGTSMGAVVGAMFALGFTPQEIEQDVLDVDWRQLMTDRPDRRQLSFRRKTDDRDNIWPFEVGLTSTGLALQRSLLAGQRLSHALKAPGLYTAGYTGFDSLPIPYRAVATDLVTGEAVILDQGNLMRAVRASMAAPGAFPPERIDDRELVDGYLRTMVPVECARDMGSDKVIAVHVGWAPGDTPDSTKWDLPGIILQSNYLLTWSNVVPELAAADVVMNVSLPDVQLIDFSQTEHAIAAGRAAVDAHLDVLLPLALSEAEYARWRVGVGRWRTESPVISAIRLENPTMVSDRTIADLFTQVAGDTLDFKALSRGLDEVYSLGVFESVDFSLEQDGPASALVIEPVAKPTLPWILRFGASYRMNYQNRGQLQFLTRLVRYEINSLGAELRTDLALGSTYGLTCEFYQPLEHSRTLFVAPAVAFKSHRESIYDGTYRTSEYRADTWGGRLDLGLNLGRVAELRGGVGLGRASAENRAGVQQSPTRHDDVGSLTFSLGFDLLDHFAIPRDGIAGSIHAWLARPELGDDLDYSRYWGHLVGATTAGEWTIHYRAQAGGSEGQMPYYREFRLGGLRDLTGIIDGSLRGGAFGMAGAGVLKHVAGLNLPYATQWYVGGWIDAGNTWEKTEDARLHDLYLGGALTLLLETAMGPAEVGYGYSSTGRGTFYLQAGIHFAQPFNR